MGVKGTVTDAASGKAIPNALIQVKNVTRIGKVQRRSDLINHDVTTGNLSHLYTFILLHKKQCF